MTNRWLKVTSEGQIVIDYAKKMRGLYGVLLKQLEDQKRSVQHLTVGVTPTAESNAISQVLALYSAQNPSIRITIITDTINNLYTKLKEYEVDFAIIEGSISDPSCSSILLDTDHLVLAASSSNPISSMPLIPISLLKQQRLILRLPSSGTRTLFETALSMCGESIDAFNIILELDNMNTIKELVQRDFGVSVISKSACLDDVRAGRFCTIPIEKLNMIREINIVYTSDFGHTDILRDIVAIYQRQQPEKRI